MILIVLFRQPLRRFLWRVSGQRQRHLQSPCGNASGPFYLCSEFPGPNTSIYLPIVVALATAAAGAAQPIHLHPQNPHYFEFGGKPTVLVTSGEHYGAILNRDFNYARYFDTLRADRLNLTRAFTGSYREVPGNFTIANNTLAPAEGKFIAPWAQRDGKFDLTRWDDAYFARLKDFVRQAGRRGVIVELVLFCPFYQDAMWNVSPMNARNNVNGIGDVARTDVLGLKDMRLTEVQEAMVRKMVNELRDFDNLYYEICNEP